MVRLRRMFNLPPRGWRPLRQVGQENDVGAAVGERSEGIWTDFRQTCDLAPVRMNNDGEHDTRDEVDRTPLHSCAQKKSTTVSKALAKRGVDLEARQEDGWSSLHICAQYCPPEIAMMLMNRGATPLHVCGQCGTTKIAEIVLERGVDPDTKDEKGWTALHVSAQYGTTKIAEMLLERGADPEAKAAKGWTALHISSQYGTTEIATLLMNRGVNVEARTKGASTPLHICAQHGTPEIAMMLTNRGADVEARSKRRYPVACLCAIRDYQDRRNAARERRRPRCK